MGQKHLSWRAWIERHRWSVGIVCLAIAVNEWVDVYPGWPMMFVLLKKDAAPAWVQGIGSILAIAASIWIMHSQDRRSRRALNEGALQLVGAMDGLAIKAMRMAAHKELQGRYAFTSMQLEVNAVVEALSRTDHLRFDSHDMIEALLVAYAAGRRFALELDVVRESIDRRVVAEGAAVMRLEDYWEMIGHAAKELHDILESRVRLLIHLIPPPPAGRPSPAASFETY